MIKLWQHDDGLTDVTSAFQGVSTPLHELIDDIHRRGWTVNKVHVKDGQYAAEGKNPHGEKLVATGRTDSTAVANLLVKIMRRDYMRSAAVKAKLGAWDPYPIEQQFSAIAQAYASAPVYDPKAAPAWMDLAQDCSRRAQTIRVQIAVEYTDDPVPYETADEMREDVTKKRHILVTQAFAHHPVWSQQQMLDYRLVVDVLGHIVGGGDWGWHGTCLAFAQLAPLLAEEPQKALFSELLGQSAFGTFYRSWGPQKVCFLEELVAKQQEKQNKPGHHPVHPSQSIVPTQLPSIFTKTAMAERSGDPTLDAAIAEFMSQHRGELGDIQDYRHPQVAWGQCEQVAEECARFLKSKGFKADVGDGDLDELGYHDAKPSESVMTPMGPAGEFTYPEHAVVCVYNEHGIVWWTIDFTAAQYGYNEFPKVEPGPPGPLIGPQRQFTGAVVDDDAIEDPNHDWQSGIPPLPDAAYLWQRANGTDPLDIHTHMEGLRQLEPGLANMHPDLAKQTVVNALRSALLGTRNNAYGHAVHYQDLAHLPANVDDPMAFWDILEQRRDAHNTAQGYAPGSHKQHWAQEQQFKQWVKAMNPNMDDGEVQRLAKRELMHMLTDEEERILAQDEGEQLPAEVVEHEAFEALKRRLKALTKPTVDQKVDFSDRGLYHEAAGQHYYHSSPTVNRESIRTRGLLTEMEPRPGEGGSSIGAPAVYFTEVPDHSLPDQDLWEADLSGYQIWPDSMYDMPSFYVEKDVPPDRLRLITPGDRASKTGTHHAGMYPPYLASNLRSLAYLGRHANELSEAARQDLTQHHGRGHHFRSQALQLNIPRLGPRQLSHAWMYLAPQTSQLGVIDPILTDLLGHDYTPDPRDYFKHERELAAARDASGYNHVPLGAYSSALWDMAAGGPNWHPDRSALKAYSPAPVSAIDWQAQTPTMPGISGQYWWDSTQPARDQVAQDFDRTVAVHHPRHEVPYARTASAGRSPWVIHPTTGERLSGPPGASLMSHLRQTFGHPDVRSVWAQDYQVGKGSPDQRAP